jgi:hypothetical protein
MARSRLTNRLARRNTVLSAGVSKRLRYQAELAAELQSVTLAHFVEKAIETAVEASLLLMSTGVPLDIQADLWQRVVWQDGQRIFEDADIRHRLDEHIDVELRDGKPTSIADEVILYDELPAQRFFLRAYLIPETLDSHSSEVWNAIKERCGTGQQSVTEAYIVSNWEIIEPIVKSTAPIRSLPIFKDKRGK